jgi:hypothetical protein
MIGFTHPITLAGFYAKKDPYQTIMVVNDNAFMVQIWPERTPQLWEEIAASPDGRSLNIPPCDTKRIKITNVEKFINTLRNITSFGINITNKCHLCDKRSEISHGFKIGDHYFIYSDLLEHIIVEHGSTVSNQFIVGMMAKINPIFGVIMLNDNDKIIKSNNGPDIIKKYPEGVYKEINPHRHEVDNKNRRKAVELYQTNYLLYKFNDRPANASIFSKFGLIDTIGKKVSGSECAPLFPPPDTERPDEGIYAVLNQPEATPEKPQIVKYCSDCIGILMRMYGADQENPTHSPCLWDGKRFTRAKQTDPAKLCGEIKK